MGVMGTSFVAHVGVPSPWAGDADEAAWAAAVVANGGTVSDARRALVRTLVQAWKAAGTWPLIDDCWLLVAENALQARTSLKQRRLSVEVAVPMFTIDRGYTFNGTTQYIDTGFIPSTHKVAMTGTNMHVAVYERTNLASNNVAAGCLNFSTQNLAVTPRNATGALSVSLNSQANGPGGDVLADSRGLSVGSRNGTLAADVLGYKNGVAVAPFAPGTLASALPTVKVFIGAICNNSSVAASFRAATEGFVSVGAAIPVGQQPAFYNALQTFMAAVGANV